MSNIIRELSRNSSSRSLRSHDSSASALNNSAYNLESFSYKMTIPFFLWFFKYRKPLKRIARLTSRKAIENSPHNKKLLEQQKTNPEDSSKESSETKFNQILFSSAPGEVEETETETKTKTLTETSTTTKTENTREINETSKVENQIKKINVISSKVDKQIFFDVIDKIQDEETQRNYLKN